MANEQSGAALRRWRPFYGAFGAIDEAIEEAGHPRAAIEDVRVKIVKLLRAATDDGVAEQLCAALDDAMAEALKTLRVTPVPHRALVSTDLVKLVGALRNHSSVWICALAVDVLRGWTTTNDVAGATVVKKLDKFSADPTPCKGISSVAVAEGNVCGYVVPVAAAVEHKTMLFVPYRQNTSETMMPVIPPNEKKPVVAQSKPIVPQSEKKPIIPQSQKIDAKKPVMTTQNEKMEITKRKLRESYHEFDRLKLQYKI